jgi:periplasmic copper chaperone A
LRDLPANASLAYALLAFMAFVAPARSQASEIGAIRIEEAWARPTLAPGQPGVVYLTLRNTGSDPDRLTGISSPRASKVELHRSEMIGTTMTMAPVGTLDLPPGATVMLKPGGYHAMLLGLSAPLKIGDTVPLALRFERAGSITIDVPVKPMTGGS